MRLRFLAFLSLSLAGLGRPLPAAPAPDAPAAQVAAPGAGPALGPFPQVELGQLENLRRDLSLRLAARMREPEFRSLAASHLGPDQTRASLTRMLDDWAELWPTPEHRQFAARVRDLDLDLRRKMGIDATAASVLGLELVCPDRGLDWSRVLFAVRPQARGQAPAWIDAYDLQGRPVRLDPRTRPEVPVVLAGIDRREAVRAGIETVNRGLRQAGFAADHPAPAPAPVECLKLTAVRVAEGQENWWGDLEVYALVSGVDPVQAKPNIKLVHLPYLHHEATDYFPNQVLVFWSDFRFSAANIQFWDHGDGVDYKELLETILKGAAAALAGAGVPVFAWIPALADAILDAMPSSWWRDSDTLLDTFYVLEKGQTYLDRQGAGSAVRVSLTPWVLQPQ